MKDIASGKFKLSGRELAKRTLELKFVIEGIRIAELHLVELKLKKDEIEKSLTLSDREETLS